MSWSARACGDLVGCPLTASASKHGSTAKGKGVGQLRVRVGRLMVAIARLLYLTMAIRLWVCVDVAAYTPYGARGGLTGIYSPRQRFWKVRGERYIRVLPQRVSSFTIDNYVDDNKNDNEMSASHRRFPSCSRRSYCCARRSSCETALQQAIAYG